MSADGRPPREPASPAPAAPGGAVGRVVRLLRLVCAGGDAAALTDWLERGQAALAGPLLRGVARGLNFYRRALWVRQLADPAARWAEWCAAGPGVPRLRVEIPAAGTAPLSVRREAPFGVGDTLTFLGDLADFDEAGKLPPREAEQARGMTADVLHAALHPLADDEGLRHRLAALRERHRGEPLRAHALQLLTALEQPTPEGLRECLRRLLLPDGAGEGCLTPECAARLFLHAPQLLAPWLDGEVFEAGRDAVAALRAGAAGGATLGQVCARLAELGEFARRLLPLYASPSAGLHREWVRHLLGNLALLAEAAGRVAEPPDAAVEIEAPPPQPALQPQTEPLPDRARAEEDAWLAGLAAEAPVVGQFLGLSAAAEELRAEAAGWHELEEALRGLHYPGGRFRQRLARASVAGDDERAGQIQDAARQLADEFLGKIRRLDALLASEGNCAAPGPGQAGAAPRAHLCRRLRAVRDRLFRVMQEHGGYEEYPVAVGDPARKHAQALEEVAYVSDPRRRPDEIVQVLEPGYLRRRGNGEPELIRPPKVVVAR
jgi:hypothetical protein